MPLVSLTRVHKQFSVASGSTVYAVNDVSLTVEPGETVALIGESGSGKSTIGRLALGLHTPDSGAVEFAGRDLSTLSRSELRALRPRMQVVFQEPYESLNPRMRVGRIVEEPIVIHKPAMGESARRKLVAETLERVGLSSEIGTRFPNALSGGQQQRVGIARAIITRPEFIVLDEPTSSLDLSIRAQILELLRELQTELGLAYLFISHDVGMVTLFARRVAVMYLGRIVEMGSTAAILKSPQHPYTRALFSALLPPDPTVTIKHTPLIGDEPDPTVLPHGCVLYGRCPIQVDQCAHTTVALLPVSSDHRVACIRVDTISAAERDSLRGKP